MSNRKKKHMKHFEAFLRSRPTTLWGRYFDIKTGDGAAEAAAWMSKVMDEYHQWIREEKVK